MSAHDDRREHREDMERARREASPDYVDDVDECPECGGGPVHDVACRVGAFLHPERVSPVDVVAKEREERAVRLGLIVSVCSYCDVETGSRPGRGVFGISHSVCPKCYHARFCEPYCFHDEPTEEALAACDVWREAMGVA